MSATELFIWLLSMTSFDRGKICLPYAALVAPQVSNLNYKENKSELAWFQTLYHRYLMNKKKYVDVIPPQKGNIDDSQKGNNVETRITRDRVGLFGPCFFRVVEGVSADFLRPRLTP